MKRAIGAAALWCSVALPALAEPSLPGEWKITIPGFPAYVGAVKIDGERRTIWIDDYGKEWRGYVAHLDSVNVEFVITGGTAVARISCTVQSGDLLHCNGKYTDGRVIGNVMILSRTERPVPRKLTATNR